MEIPRDKITMIMGPSGTGKSVCIGHMVGLLRPDSGTVAIEGEQLGGQSEDELLAMRKDKFGVLFQDGALFSSMTVAQNVDFPLVHNT